MAKDLIASIKEKQALIAKLQSELDEARALLGGVRTGGVARVQFVPAGKRKSAHRLRRTPVLPYKPNSSVGKAVKVLKKAGVPMHVDELAAKIGRKVKKTTLVGNLSRYVKAGLVFCRTAPGEFGLLDWQERGGNDRKSKRNPVRAIAASSETTRPE